ncbi:MAG: beta-galactosidase [Thermoguttaceae bacterium]
MIRTRFALLIWIVSLISTISPSAGLESVAANEGLVTATGPATVTLPAKVLRGYGELSAVLHEMRSADGTASLTRITCQSPEKALLVQAKYLSDVGLVSGSDTETRVVGELSIPVRMTSADGAVACYAAGREAVILAASSRKAFASLVDRHVPASIRADAFAPHAQVPKYLDRFDKYGLLVYYGPWITPPRKENYDYRVDFRFARENKFGLILWQTPLPDDTAEGMNNEKAWDWIQEECRSLDVPLHVNLSFSWPMLWLGNRYREETMLKSPQFVGGFYGVAHDSCGAGAVSWHSEKAKAVALGILQETVRRYAKDPNIVGWLEPHSETADNPQGLLVDYGPVADRSLQRYMKERYGSLDKVCQRWYGDATHYHAWDEIRTPEPSSWALVPRLSICGASGA